MSEKIENTSTTTDSAEFVDTGIQAKTQGKKKFYFSTQDLLIASILGVIGGFISGLIPFSLLIKTWYPFVGGTQLVSGHHLLWMAIAYGLTNKKPIILLTGVIQGFVNFMLGASWGILEVAITSYEAFFLLVGFVIIHAVQEEKTSLGWALAGGIGNVSQVPLFWIITGKIYILDPTLFVMAMMFAFISGVLISGLLAFKIVERIKITGTI